MLFRLTSLVSTGLLLFTLMGCGSKRKTGAVIGATTGAVAGEAVDDEGEEGAIIGAIAGGIAGYAIGDYMEASDQQQMVKTLKETPPGETRTWENRDTGRSFAMTPGRSYRTESERLCRDFTMKMIERGETKTFSKRGCRSAPSGSWRITNQQSKENP